MGCSEPGEQVWWGVSALVLAGVSGGGFGIPGSVLDDDEFIHLLGRNPPPCP